MINKTQTTEFVNQFWEKEIVPQLIEYIKIPNKSPAFDPNWQENGFMEKVLQNAKAWVETQNLPNMNLEILREPERTPLLLVNLKGSLSGQIMMYGHLDKQPEMQGWREGLGPWIPVREGELLYGRGGADDGYALYASVCAVQNLIRQNIAYPNIQIVIEFSEESGSEDLPFYFKNQAAKFAQPDLIVCLDSGAGNYEQMWCTTSLRGMVLAKLKAHVLEEGVHSGDASGVVPSSFRILRGILDRIENKETGEIFPEAFKVKIPEQRISQAQRTAATLGDLIYTKFKFKGTTKPVLNDNTDLLLNKTWRAQLSVTGLAGAPDPVSAGNVLRPATEAKLSLRVPPTANAKACAQELKKLLEANPPHQAQVTCEILESAAGWNAPETAPWLEKLLSEASKEYYQKDCMYIGEGGSIPFMGMLGETFPKAQFVITGVLGPQSNAHGPNEFLHIEYAKKLTSCISYILDGFSRK